MSKKIPPTWIDEVSENLKNLAPESLSEPQGKVAPDEHVVGTANASQKRLFTLANRLKKASNDLIVEARNAKHNKRRAKYYVKKATELRVKSEAVMQILWISLNDSFDLWEKPYTGIRKRWRVVWFSRPDNSPPDIGKILVMLAKTNCGCPTCLST